MEGEINFEHVPSSHAVSTNFLLSTSIIKKGSGDSVLAVEPSLNVLPTSQILGLNNEVDRREGMNVNNDEFGFNNGEQVALGVGIDGKGSFNFVEVGKEEAKNDKGEWLVDHEYVDVSLDTVMSDGGEVGSSVGRKWKKLARTFSGKSAILPATDIVGKNGKRERDKMVDDSFCDSNKKLARDVSSSGWRLARADVDQSRPAQ